MNKKYILPISFLLLTLLLTACFGPRVHITGQIVDQNGRLVEGINVICKGSTDRTDSSGRFSFTIESVDYPTDVNITFEGSKLGFETSTRSIRIEPDEDRNMGKVTLQRVKALIYGEVTGNFFDQSMQPMNTEQVELPTRPNLPYPEGEIIVKFKDSVQTQGINTLSANMNLEVVKKFSKMNIFTVRAAGDMDQTIQSLKERPDVEYAEPNYYIYPLSVETDQITPSGYVSNYAWNLEAINVPLTWTHEETGSRSVTVAVLDTGIERNLSDLEYNIDWELGYDFVDNDDDPSVWWETHGTQVASIIGARPDNGYGIDGVNQQVSIVPIRILNSVNNDGVYGKTTDLLLGMEHAINMGVDIINLSIAMDIPIYSDSQAVNEMIDLAERSGVLIVAAAGNDGDSTPVYPASHSRVLSVGAVGPTLQPASYTNRGVDIYAPGGDYYLYPASQYNTIKTLEGWAQGTSIASAHVAGVAALLKASSPYLSPAEMRYRLTDTSLQFPYDDISNPGLVDAYRAITNIEHGRIAVFVGHEESNYFRYESEESTYTYIQSGKNMYQISTVPPGWHWVYAWVDRDADGRLSYYDYYAEEHVYLDEGDQQRIDLQLRTWY